MRKLDQWEMEKLAERVRTELGSNSGTLVDFMRTEIANARVALENFRLAYLERVLLKEFANDLARVAAEETEPAIVHVQQAILRILLRILNAEPDAPPVATPS